MIITAAVYEETVVRGRAAGHADAEVIDKAVRDGMIRVVALREVGCRRLEEAQIRGMRPDDVAEMMAYVRMHSITPPGDMQELRTDVAGMLARLGHSDLARQVLRPE